MWCNDKKTLEFIISRDVTFDKCASLTDKQREDALAKSNRSIKEQLHIEVNAVIQSIQKMICKTLRLNSGKLTIL